jgi:DNA (cytosine-5)-methyltransferase 1
MSSAQALKRREEPEAAADKPPFLEFFAGSGLVAYALRPYFHAAWANDISEKKAVFYTSNHGKEKFHLGSIADVKGAKLPYAQLAWASFPCQDLSLAGNNGGIHAERSGLVWEWLRIIDEMPVKPPVLVAENVLGLVSGKNGAHYRALHAALHERHYKVGAILLDAVRWVPQSRPRIFVVAVREDVVVPAGLMDAKPNWLHPQAVVKAAEGLEGWIWWKMPQPPNRKQTLMDILDWDAPCDKPKAAAHNIKLIPPHHKARLESSDIIAAPGYKRTRAAGQVLELRFDGIAGCLRTPEGGSSRQFLVLKRDGKLTTRLLTARETARLMGAPESYKLPGTYNDGYKAMGDAVAAPVARHLAKHLLFPLVEALDE